MMTKTNHPWLLSFFLVGILLVMTTLTGLAAYDRQDSSLVQIEGNRLSYDETITVIFENRWSEPVAVITSGCGLQDGSYAPKLVVEKEEEGRWVRAGAPICIAIATPPIRLAPGETEEVEMPVRLGLEESTGHGTFRYVFDIRREQDRHFPAGSGVPPRYRTSPPFTIRPGR